MNPTAPPYTDDRCEPQATGLAGHATSSAKFAVSSTAARQLPLIALAVLTGALFWLCALLAYPFLPALTWGVALAILAWPMHRVIARRFTSRSLAAGLSTAAVVVVILVPALFVAYRITREAAAAAEQASQAETGATIREKAAEVPGVGGVVRWMERAGIDVEARVRQTLRSYTWDVSDLATNTVASTIQCLVAVFLLYFLFRDRAEFLSRSRALLPLSKEEGDEVLASVADSVHANLYATVVTSLIDTAGFGAIFWMFGLPAPLLWTVVMFVLSLLPILGAALVWVPTAAYLAMTAQWLPAMSLLGWGILTFIAVDNALYARLAGERMRMHPVPALIAFLGGVAVFGASGMVLGPAIVAVTGAVLGVWKRRLAGSRAPAETAAAGDTGRISFGG